MSRMKTTEEFIAQAEVIHGNKYDYSNSQYIGLFKKLTITCKTHGDFQQRPSDHKAGCGCPKCYRYLLTTEKFVAKAKAVHGDKYDYSKSQGIGTRKNRTITCETHGDFQQSSAIHLAGSGCPKCALLASRLTTEEFVARAKAIHGGKYDYSKAQSNGIRKKLTITCKIHGDFQQSPKSHLVGSGCPKCARLSSRLTTDKFVAQAKVIHGDKYDYSKSKCIGAREKLTIVCKIHGDFQQSPNLHKQGRGCPECGKRTQIS